MTALWIVAVNAGLSEPSSTRLLVDRMVAAVTEGLGAGRSDVEIVDLRDLAADLGQAMTVGFASGRARAWPRSRSPVADAMPPTPASACWRTTSSATTPLAARLR